MGFVIDRIDGKVAVDMCPVCGGHIEDGGFVEIASGRAYQTCSCENGHEWTDVYELVDQYVAEEE